MATLRTGMINLERTRQTAGVRKSVHLPQHLKYFLSNVAVPLLYKILLKVSVEYVWTTFVRMFMGVPLLGFILFSSRAH